MSLTFVLGRAGVGKTNHIIEQMIKDEHAIYLVPEQFTLGAEREILAKVDATTINVLSFTRLAYRVFSSEGLKTHTVLDDISKSMLIRKITKILEPELYHKIAANQGFIEKIVATITELTRQGIRPEDLSPLLDHTGAISIKTKDMIKIYAAYQSYMNKNYISADEALDILKDKIQTSGFLKGKKIYIDAFDSFAGTEYKVIEQLIKHNEVMIGLTVDLADDKIFQETSRTYGRIKALAGTNITEIHLTQNHRLKTTPLVFLEQDLFGLEKTYDAPSDSVLTTYCANNYEEVKMVAKKIGHLIRKKGYAYREIAVLAPESYHFIIENSFSEYAIPYFIDKKSDILHHPITSTILLVMETIVYHDTNETLFGFLKSGLTDISDRQIDRLENYVLQYGITTQRKWQQDKWTYETDPVTSETTAREQDINAIKAQVMRYLNAFNGCFGKDKTIREIATVFFEVLTQTNITKNIEALINEDLLNAADYLQVWKLVGHVFEVMVEFLGDETISAKEFLQIVKTGMASVDMGRVPEQLDAVPIATFAKSRLSEIKALFVVGSNEISYPIKETFYTDKEIKHIKDLGFYITTAEDDMTKEQFVWYSFLTKPSEYIELMFSNTNLVGKAKEKSAIVSLVESVFVNQTHEETHVSTEKHRLRNLAENLQNYYETGKIRADHLYLYKWYEKEKYPVEKIDKLARGLRQTHLSEASVSELYEANEIVSSVSRLERYNACPFSYFADYNLQLSERKHFEIENVDIGNILHDILEQFTKQQKNLKSITKEEINTATQHYAKASVERYQFLFEEGSGAFALKRIIDIAKTSIWALCKHISSGDFDIFGTEVNFGENGPITSIVIEINEDKKFILKGKVDRIDILDSDNNTYVKVIDYKSGSKKFDIKDVYYGMQMQLLIYLNAIIKSGAKYFDKHTKLLPGGIFYFRLKDPLVNISDIEQVEKKLLDEFKMSGLVLENEHVKQAMQNDASENISKTNVDLEGFNDLMDVAIECVKDIGKEMISGNVNPFPYKKGTETPCTYCDFRSVCKFDTKKGKDVFNIKTTSDVMIMTEKDT